MDARIAAAFLLLACQFPVRDASAVTIEVDNYGIPGATTADIRNAVLTSETLSRHHEVWIILGGVNDIAYSKGNMPWVQDQLYKNWTAIASRGRELGVEVYFSELTPIAASELDLLIPEAAPMAPKIDTLNNFLDYLALLYQLNVIRLHDPLAPHWNTLPDAWCLNFVNDGRLDGQHPNAKGAEGIARQLWSAIQPAVSRGKRSFVLYGDSILATAYLPPDQRVDAWLEKLAREQRSAVAHWQKYK